jgi:type I restriction enzyme, S subunit
VTLIELPEGWMYVRFGDVVRNVNENSRDPEADGLDRVVGLDHLNPGSLRLDRWDNLGDLPDGTTFTRKFKPGQVLFGKRRAYQRKVAVPAFEGICSGDLLVFEPADNRMLPEFLPYVVQSDGFFEHALGTSAGSLSPRTKWAELAKYEFALPPLVEQEVIAEILGMSGVLVTKYAQAESNAVLLSRSLLDESFLRANWVPLEAKAAVELGKKRDPKLLREGVPVPYLRAANVKPSEFDLSDVMAMNFTSAETEYFTLRDGDVLVTEGCGSINQVGACAVWRDQLIRPVCFQMTLLRLRARDAGDAKLLGHWAQHAFVSGRFAAVSSGTSVFHLSAARVRKMPFPVLCDDEQRSLVEKLDRLSELVGALQSAEGRALSVHLALREKLLEGSRGHVH